MPRARKQCASGRRTRRTRRTARWSEDEVRELIAMGGAVTSQDGNPPNQETPTSLQTPEKVLCSSQTPEKVLCSSQTPALPQEPESNRKCPTCSSYLKPSVISRGSTSSLLLCSQCSTTLLCKECLYPCPDGTCTNKSCQVISMLLACEKVTDKSSRVYGAPLFRACPKCHSLMMYEKGCKYVRCAQCKHAYCFICLRASQECRQDTTKYWSLNCSAPRAPRQRFQT